MSERRAGTVLSIAATVIQALLALVTTPVIVGALGMAGFGLYGMALAVLAMFALFEGGLTDALVRLAVRRRRETALSIGDCLAGALPLYLRATEVLVALAFSVMFGLALIAPGEMVQAGALALLALVGAVATILGGPYRAVMVAAERFVAARLIEIGTALATATLTILAARAGAGPVGVLAGVVAGLVLCSLLRALYAHGRLGMRLTLSPMPAADRAELRRSATPILGAAVVEAVYWRLATILTGIVLGPAAVAPLAVALIVQKHMMRLSAAVSRVMVPATLKAVEEGASAETLAASLARVASVQALFLGAVTIGLAAFGDAFFRLWLGPDLAMAHGLALVVAIPFALEQIGSLRNTVLQGRGLYGAKARQSLVVAGGVVVLTLALLPVAGVWGAAVATAAGLLVALALVNRLLALRGGFDVRLFYRLVAGRSGPALAALAGAAALIDSLPVAGWGGLAARGGLFAMAFLLAGGWVAGADERARLFALARGFLRGWRAGAVRRPATGFRLRRC